MPLFYVYLHSKAGSLDDNVYKCIAKSSVAAKKMARRNDTRERYNIGHAFSTRELKKVHPDWYSLAGGWKADT